MAIPILHMWQRYFDENRDEGLGSSYERIILNNKMESICEQFHVKKILEAPSFGFTGLSGINSLGLAQKGRSVSVLDHDVERLEKIQAIWAEAGQALDGYHVSDYSILPFPDQQFDLSWNFSALWFVSDLDKFLQELTRVTSKVIVLAVPNRRGLGYISQKLAGKEDLKKYLKERFIIPKNFKIIMTRLGWNLQEWNYIDCPPWPDIGMPKEKFLAGLGLKWLLPKEKEKKAPLTIMDYYAGKDEDFPKKMMQHYWLEKKAPRFLKMFWAHHRYFIFIKVE